MVTFETREKRLLPIRVTLVALWVALAVWLGVEHMHTQRKARTALLQRARDISDTIALISRSSRSGLIREDRLNRALSELVQWDLLEAIVLLNARGETVASAGHTERYDPKTLELGAVRWSEDSVIVMNLVDLGSEPGSEPQTRNPTIVIPAPDREDQRFRPPGDRDTSGTLERREMPMGPPPPPPPDDRVTSGPLRQQQRPARPPWARDSSGRPPWMSESEFRDLIERRGFHSFVLILNARPMRDDLAADRNLRLIVAVISLLGVAGLLAGLTQWSRSTSLLLKLVQSQQQNESLRELNLAAAGLAHETRNPLNVVRGVAQLIDHDPASPPEIRDRVRQIMEEIDMVTFRLNEFIRYSRPPQPHLSATNPTTVAENVRTALQSDIEGRDVTIEVETASYRVEADEMLLRQLLFNLMMNAVQAVCEPGRIRVHAEPGEGGQLRLIVDDNGPGVAEDLRQEVFRPYFTTSDRGSGLGLAVVRQICVAHGWNIECTTAPLGGARFVLSGLRMTTTPPATS
ncbi:hypothetical protein GC173_05890 [bacterium]|nr:hypothetical protein [bacterium]